MSRDWDNPRPPTRLERALRHGQLKFALERDREAELLLNDASDYLGGSPDAKPDLRAWQHLLIYAPTSVLVRALFRRLVKRFTYRWRN